MRRAFLLCAVAVAAFSQTGCVERLLAIQSDPPGAAAYLDGEKVGTTPCEVAYTWYGTRVLVLELRGFNLVRQEIILNPPWWQLVPIDFISDVLIPMTLRDRVSVSYTLDPAPVSPEQVDAVLDRADELRKRAVPPKE
jgi:PEGA domain-containing protein